MPKSKWQEKETLLKPTSSDTSSIYSIDQKSKQRESSGQALKGSIDDAEAVMDQQQTGIGE